jgi:hypothetical protein
MEWIGARVLQEEDLCEETFRSLAGALDALILSLNPPALIIKLPSLRRSPAPSDGIPFLRPREFGKTTRTISR